LNKTDTETACAITLHYITLEQIYILSGKYEKEEEENSIKGRREWEGLACHVMCNAM